MFDFAVFVKTTSDEEICTWWVNVNIISLPTVLLVGGVPT
jgi:hypothetical protein